ncbi:hypothetical protein PF003_g11908 [Phytophthora fragariae]|uniref:DUF6818 domain-containing protein n=1 Tax=Phytophthora fragariae TaxID=53985 RepID=A0A6A3E044_9STRA|nr:hypothetical protein PF003_g11908 [Phytophthora fragariae]KAE8925883.1 hypothetical protein PF009_g23916 [Phytophthora fragariae]
MGPTPRKKKGKNYTLSELNRMLDLVERMLPFGSEQWENLAACYNTHIPSGHAERDGDSLSRKFKKLYKVPKPSEATLHSDSDAEDNSEDELDSVDASGPDDLMAAFDQAAEESQSLLNRMPPAPIDTSPSNNTAQPSPNEMPLAPDRMPLTPPTRRRSPTAHR